ncbi:head-tail connector protein [Novosphingobium lentum]|uniref:head-tail connector protein n=1 Tax=Novosphingobium lentum TaxID=145287 RepID=UPI00082EAA7F|nr:hypothetical protein [Novosphingobium lentum]
MKRAIIAPPALSPAALDELKAWLGVTTTGDDAELIALLRTALELCEGFTGRMPLLSTCEDVLPGCAGWQALSVRPVQTIAGVAALAPDGTRSAVSAAGYELDLDAEGGGRVRLLVPISVATLSSRIVVTFTAGLAPTWDSLPDAIRHGVIRLAAHHHTNRDAGAGAAEPPATVAALWRPWRRVRVL